MLSDFGTSSLIMWRSLGKFGCNGCDGQVVRTTATGAVDSGLFQSLAKPMILKLLFTAASLLDALQRNNVENKPANLRVVSLGKALSRIPPS